jgi:small subunit ribosomal protein S6
MNRIYEEMFIVRPDATEEEITPIIDQLKSTVTSAGGTVDKEERWGVRKLAYRVEKRNEGYYVLMQFTAGPQTVKEVERRLRVNDAVLKYMTVRIDEKLKKIEKRKKVRDKRAARKPAPVVAAPATGSDDARRASAGRTDAGSACSGISRNGDACGAECRGEPGVRNGGTKRRTSHRFFYAAHRRR